MPPGASAWAVAHRAGLLSRIALLTAPMRRNTSCGSFPGGWLAQGALQGRFDAGWLMAWALLLFTMVPLRALTAWLQGVVALTAGGLLKERLLVGAFRLESDEVRRQGVGQLLGRVLESEALESLALSGGFLALVASIELAVAAVVLFAGAGGALHAALLVAVGRAHARARLAVLQCQSRVDRRPPAHDSRPGGANGRPPHAAGAGAARALASSRR